MTVEALIHAQPVPRPVVPKANPLAGLPCLSSKVAIYIPMQAQDVSEQCRAFQRELACESLARYFGGYTLLRGHGGWLHPEHCTMIEEPMWVAYAFAESQQVAACTAALVKLAGRICRNMLQHCVGLEIDGKLYFVGADRAEI